MSIPTISMQHLIHTPPLGHIDTLSWSRFQRLIIYIPPHHEPRSGLKMWDDFSHIQCMSHFDLQWTQVKWLNFDSNFGLANLFTDNTRWQSWANSLESYHCVKWGDMQNVQMFKMETPGGRVGQIWSYQCVKWGDMQSSQNDICPHSHICNKLSQVLALQVLHCSCVFWTVLLVIWTLNQSDFKMFDASVSPRFHKA